MKTHLECIPCFIKQSLEAARMATNDEGIHERVIKEVMEHLQNISFKDSPPELSKDVHSIIRSITNSNDPYKKVKEESNENAKKLYPTLKELVNTADDPLLAAIQLSIVGNVIDFGTFKRFDINDSINTNMREKFVDNGYSRFKEVLNNSRSVLYLGDNTGETFFDRLLLEEISKKVKQITYVVKANPVINDALFEDAVFAGIDKIARVIEGDAGQDRSTPGILLKFASEEFLENFNSADMVISKGQGNYESLNLSDREIFFLLMVKCPLVGADIGINEGSFVLKVK